MSRIHWPSYAADFETVMGICLSRESASATRIKPSRGDKGIDIFMPEPDGWTVYQIKSFTGSLTSSQKRQIRESWARIIRYVDAQKVSLKAWFLLTPENPTTEKLEWLRDEVTGTRSFPTVWKAQDFADSLAAKYPEVIDYYLRDSRERLETKVRELVALMHGERVTDDLTPADTLVRLSELSNLVNSFDPHYRYDFAVQGIEQDVEEAHTNELIETPGLFAAMSLTANGQRAIVKIFPRYRGAPDDRPVPGSFKVELDPDSEERRRWQDFIDYGTPMESPVTAANVSIDLPGGLGFGDTPGLLQILTSPSSPTPRPLELVITSETGEQLARAVVKTEPATIGWSGLGSRIAGNESGGVFRFELRVRADGGPANYSMRSLDITGTRPSDVLAGIEFLHAFHAPNYLQIKIEQGPRVTSRLPIELEEADEADAWNIMLTVRALTRLQRNTAYDLRVPDLTQISTTEATEWVRAGRLLEGERLKLTHGAMTVCLAPGKTDMPQPFSVSGKLPFEVDVADQHLSFGHRILYVPALVRVPDTSPEPHGDHLDVWVEPMADVTPLIYWHQPHDPLA